MVLFVLLVSLAFAVNTEFFRQNQELEKKYYEQLEKLKNYKPPELDPEKKKELERKVKELQNQTLQHVEKKTDKPYLSNDVMVYVFMSSSVPEVVWKRYMDVVEGLGLENKVVFVLRGCIGGCKYFRPTLEFIQKLTEKRKVGVIIDPLLFRRFGVREVPCVGMSKADQLLDPTASAGLETNLIRKGQTFLSCGDWAFGYHLKELCRQSNEPSICQLARPLP